jgi:hypothetical protein
MVAGQFPPKKRRRKQKITSLKFEKSCPFVFVSTMSSNSISLGNSSLLSVEDAETMKVPKAVAVKTKVAANSKPSSDAEKKSAPHFHWPSMELCVVKDVHGSKHDAYPFLNDSNEFDKALMRNLLVYRPFLQKKGEQTTIGRTLLRCVWSQCRMMGNLFLVSR